MVVRFWLILHYTYGRSPQEAPEKADPKVVRWMMMDDNEVATGLDAYVG
jgi:hypothetical protein